LIEYFSNDIHELDDVTKTSDKVSQYSKFSNSHYELVSKVEEKVTKHGHPNCSTEDGDFNFMRDLEAQIEGINTI
jgi:hypothetical protein